MEKVGRSTKKNNLTWRENCLAYFFIVLQTEKVGRPKRKNTLAYLSIVSLKKTHGWKAP